MVEEPRELFGALSIQHCLAEQSCPAHIAERFAQSESDICFMACCDLNLIDTCSAINSIESISMTAYAYQNHAFAHTVLHHHQTFLQQRHDSLALAVHANDDAERQAIFVCAKRAVP